MTPRESAVADARSRDRSSIAWRALTTWLACAAFILLLLRVAALYWADELFRVHLSVDVEVYDCNRIPQGMFIDAVARSAIDSGGADPATVRVSLTQKWLQVDYTRVITILPGLDYIGGALRLPRSFEVPRTCP